VKCIFISKVQHLILVKHTMLFYEYKPTFYFCSFRPIYMQICPCEDISDTPHKIAQQLWSVSDWNISYSFDIPGSCQHPNFLPL
jgi:hypothetical protein